MSGFRKRRLERAELELADAEHHYEAWIRPFWPKPSERVRAERRIRKAQTRVRKWGGVAPED